MEGARALVLCLDFHKSLYIPKVSSQDAYYKTRLITRLFGIYEAGEQKLHAFIYPANVGGEGPDEVLSLLAFLIDKIQTETDLSHLILWSDNCPGQFKECFLFFYCDFLVQTKRFLRVDLKFFLEGHTYGICDTRFGSIEIATNRSDKIETPKDWINQLRGYAIKNLELYEVTLDMIKSYKTFLRKAYVSRNKDEDGISFSVRSLAWLSFGIGECENDNGVLQEKSLEKGNCLMRKSIDPHEKPIRVCFLKKKQQKPLISKDLKAKRTKLKPVLSDVKRNCLNLAKKYLSREAIEYYLSLPEGVVDDDSDDGSD